MIDEHEVVMRFHRALSPLRPEWASAAGSKTTLRLLDHEVRFELFRIVSTCVELF